jgi:shikimate kinase
MECGKPNVYLVGPMGVGKTTIGRLLSDFLGLSFVDIDKEIESRAGADIPWIFDVETESGFRSRESKTLEDISATTGQVISTGGGVVLQSTNRDIMKRGFCIYLRAELDQLVSRIGKDKKRPLLQKGDPRMILAEILKVREPLYQEVAKWTVQTDSRPPRLVVRDIVRLLKSSGKF